MKEREKLQRILGLSDHTYNNLVIEAGQEYLKQSIGYSDKGKEALNRSNVYWRWWWETWERIDKGILEMTDPFPMDVSIQGENRSQAMIEQYMAHHCYPAGTRLPRLFWSQLLEATRADRHSNKLVRKAA